LPITHIWQAIRYGGITQQQTHLKPRQGKFTLGLCYYAGGAAGITARGKGYNAYG